MDKKTIIIVASLGIVILFWMPILQFVGVVKPTPSVITPSPADSASSGAGSSNAANSTSKAPTSAVNGNTTQPTASFDTTATVSGGALVDSSLALAAPVAPETVFVETQKYRVALSTHGGGPVSLILKDYGYAWSPEEKIDLLKGASVVEPQVSFKDGAMPIGNLIFRPSVHGKIDATNSPRTVEFTHTRSDGAELVRSYTFNPNEYSFEMAIRVPRRAAWGIERSYKIEWVNGLGATEWDEKGDYTASFGMALLASERELLGSDGFFGGDWEDEKFSKSLASDVRWVGKRSKHFAAIMAPRNKVGEEAFGSGNKFNARGGRGTEIPMRSITVGMRTPIASADALVDSFIIYAGPLDWQGMKAYDREFETMFDIGTTPVVGWLIKLFAIPIIWVIPHLYSVVRNYGIVIILLAIGVKLLTWPLARKSVKSMAAMRELGPRLEKLKEKHKNNPQALQSAMMKMYKEAGVNPLSSCLPMLPQLPLFFALFSVFNSTILFRGAPFVYPWTDLSRGATGIIDPYIILVLVMVALMFIQQKMTVTDPRQKMMVYLMPLLFGFMFYQFASGLVIYWSTFSGWSVVEQWYVQRQRERENSHIKNIEE